MGKILAWLSGKKTYITAVLLAVFNFGLVMGWWDDSNQVIIAVNSLLTALGIGFLRAGVTKSGPNGK
jgi:hypothetical protein